MRECICCHKEHSYCYSCPSDKYLESWHVLYCSKNCHDLFNAVNKYVFGHITKEEAKKQLEKCDLSVLPQCSESFQKVAKQILAEEQKKVKHKEIKQEVVVDKNEVSETTL